MSNRVAPIKGQKIVILIEQRLYEGITRVSGNWAPYVGWFYVTCRVAGQTSNRDVVLVSKTFPVTDSDLVRVRKGNLNRKDDYQYIWYEVVED
jgi:hypothetical protein